MSIFQILVLVLLAVIALYTVSLAFALNRLVDHNLKFHPEQVANAGAQGALTALERYTLMPGEEVLVKWDGQEIRAKLVAKGEAVELLPQPAPPDL